MNCVRILTLIKRECVRFFRVYNQTIISPAVNALIFYLIFTVAFAGRVKSFDGASYTVIVSMGLIAMSVLQATYYNTQSTISIARMLGFIKDYTITPLRISEIFIGMVVSSLIRAFCVGILTFIILIFFVDIQIHNVFLSICYIILGAVLFSSIGIVIGFISQDFDKAHAYTSYIITPLTMLSGTFYSAATLPNPWRNIVLFNPVFYIIDGFRYGLTGIGGGYNHVIIIPLLFVSVILVCFFALFVLRKNLQT